ncbi:MULTISPECIES: hypothetical protein [Kitasatospora]|uniref:Uncharacterized protein n=1 Tax=Kitasatospora setae (strain ATCC 33774 / DSM 43861 / JCM 3304 / KCC A-0304 / NBRC 14216 / KM-6054) TaxID=452652 RepID=E4NEY3_KITSK|nr:hypothetical protein [Kitasatospora setae]BAJ29919.1 hypothetical protein KSE_41320 [Kitasatospora setae KM-6054]
MTVLALPLTDEHLPLWPTAPTTGRFYTGRRKENRPESLPSWRLSDTTAETASAVALVLGGLPTLDDGQADLVTRSAVLPVVLDSPAAVSTELRLWGPKGLVHHCDGTLFLSPSDLRGMPCGCPVSAGERSALAKRLQAPQPETTVSFRLAGHPELGRFEFRSPSRLFADSAAEVRSRLVGATGDTICRLALELVTVLVSGGAELSFRAPRLAID